MTLPAGYWVSIFDKARNLLKQRKDLNADQAYLLAKHEIDSSLPEPQPSLQFEKTANES